MKFPRVGDLARIIASIPLVLPLVYNDKAELIHTEQNELVLVLATEQILPWATLITFKHYVRVLLKTGEVAYVLERMLTRVL